MSTEPPAVNSKWRHPSGALYVVAVVTNTASTRDDYPPTVVYFSEHDVWWSRPLSAWPGSLVPEHAQ